MKNLKETLKDLYGEFPRTFSNVRCSEQTYEAIREGAAVRIVGTPRYSIADLQVSVDVEISGNGFLALYDRHHIREGIVVRPIPERTAPHQGRVHLKLVSNSYLEKEK